MLTLYRCVNPVYKCKKLTGLTQVVGFGHDAPPQRWETARSFLQAGSRSITHAVNNLNTLANKAEKISLSCSRGLSNNASTQDGKLRVKRVSIEGNIGKMFFLFVHNLVQTD